MNEIYKDIGINGIMSVEDKLILDLADLLHRNTYVTTTAKEAIRDIIKLHKFNT